MKYRFIPHPEDELKLFLNYGKQFDIIDVYIEENPFNAQPHIIQVNGKLTVKDRVLTLYAEYVNKDQFIVGEKNVSS